MHLLLKGEPDRVRRPDVDDTFDTGGVCPACGRQWSETQCPRCRAWSRHEDWYEDEPADGGFP